MTLRGHNFVCRPLIGMKSATKLQPSSRAFQWYVAHHLNIRKLGRFLTFSGRDSNLIIQLPALLLTITCVSDVQIGHASPFQTFTFQELSNDIRNSSIRWVLTPAIVFRKFESPLGLQLLKWESSFGSVEVQFSHSPILSISQEHEV